VGAVAIKQRPTGNMDARLTEKRLVMAIISFLTPIFETALEYKDNRQTPTEVGGQIGHILGSIDFVKVDGLLKHVKW